MKRNLIVVLVLVAIALIVYAMSVRNDSPAVARVFNLAEFGVAIDIPATLSNLSYVVQEPATGTGQILNMRINDTCTLGAFFQIQKDGIENSGSPWSETLLEQGQLPVGSEPARVKEFTDFYLVFEPSPDTCSTDERESARELEQKNALWNALVSARYMSY